MNRVLKYVLLASTGILAGCVDLTHFNSSQKISSVQGEARQTYIDAKQRLVITAPVTRTVATRSADGHTTSTTETTLRFCSEPSPDALSALAASGGGNLSAADKIAIGGQFAFSEGASSIGLRTQTIQMMRDAMYRLCEATSSGIMTPLQFEMMHRRFQNSMVAILAIEQLTGAVHGPAAAISGRADFGNSELVAKLADKVTAARSAVGAAEADTTAKEAASSTATSKRDAFLKSKNATDRDGLADADKPEFDKFAKAVADADSAVGAASAVVATRKADLANYQSALASAQGGDLQTGSTAIFSGAGQRALDGNAIASLADAVERIVKSTYELGYFRETCAALFTAEIEGRSGIGPAAGNLSMKCLEYAEQTTKLIQKRMEAADKLSSVIIDQKADPAVRRAAIDKISEVLEDPGNLMLKRIVTFPKVSDGK